MSRPGWVYPPSTSPLAAYCSQNAVLDAMKGLRLSAELIQKYESEGFWRGDTIYSLARWNAGHKPDSFAVRDRFRRLTYRQLLKAVDTLAADLAAHGVRPGQRVGVWLQSRIENVVALLACSKSGAICCPSLHRDHTVDQVVELIDRMRAAAVIVQPGYGADSEQSDLVALAGRDFLRCALHVGPVTEAAFADLPGPAADTPVSV